MKYAHHTMLTENENKTYHALLMKHVYGIYLLYLF